MISKKVLFSVMLIGLIGVAAGAGTFAFFSDTEEADGVFMAGTIDIAVDGENPWSQSYEMIDMKPCKQVEDANVNITNVGTNPALIFKHINVTDYNTGLELFTAPTCDNCNNNDVTPQVVDNNDCEWWCGEEFSSEPEWTAEKQLGERVDDIHNVTEYSITIDGELIDLECFLGLEDVTVGDIECKYMFLGVLDNGDSMMVNQTYKLSADAGNEYQGDQFNFKMKFIALQTNDDTTIPEYIDLTQPCDVEPETFDLTVNFNETRGEVLKIINDADPVNAATGEAQQYEEDTTITLQFNVNDPEIFSLGHHIVDGDEIKSGDTLTLEMTEDKEVDVQFLQRIEVGNLNSQQQGTIADIESLGDKIIVEVKVAPENTEEYDGNFTVRHVMFTEIDDYPGAENAVFDEKRLMFFDEGVATFTLGETDKSADIELGSLDLELILFYSIENADEKALSPDDVINRWLHVL
ncbi:M73 family secreted endopeptidase [Methanonatronarchaeum thermophilum]|uniref:M73 family secreted endopeptidase n=1 Tax=Methanonatronarchaeum thermophilum TaxID=1927129 RepID=A0A1Y3GBC3_9EURY|nr:TasA family protein [Methanonatronarchaeum thermophilum]OUJ18762.1 M73 family secreted endopeptidase [Methanonatronarchaeum thermophilum]